MITREQFITPGAQIRNTLIRFFKTDHPFRDAEHHEEFTLVITQQDWDKAKRGDPTCCALARACHRQFNFHKGDPGVAILHTIAYVALPEPESPTKWKVLRYYIATPSHNMWDKGIHQEAMTVRLIAPSEARTLEARRQACTRHRLSHPRRPHKKARQTVLVHTLPRGYDRWWTSKSPLGA